MNNVPVIHPDAVFDLHTLRETLDLKPGCLPRECRLGRLRYCKRGGKVLFVGRWVLQWLEAGEVKRRRGAEPANREAESSPNGMAS
jgi:hypothetical protein